ncbi:MAG: hypothetical protein M1460_00605 [Candidatus Thermoplasmatota archaeon]|jgi:hypothetical protein|nr:hypothetical protein [Candidatus Thermoplasmatota archaeon]
MVASGEQKDDVSIEELIEDELKKIESLVETELKERLDIMLRRALMPDIDRLKLTLLESKQLYNTVQNEFVNENENRLENIASSISKIGNLRNSLDTAVRDAYSKIGGADRSLMDWITYVKFNTANILEKIMAHAIQALKKFAKDSGVSSYGISFGYYDLSVTLNFNVK